MGCMLICIATTAIGVDYTWEQTEDGEVIYVIQIEPHLLEALKNGEEEMAASEVDPLVRGHVRRFRVVYGDQPLDPPVPSREELKLKPPDNSTQAKKPTVGPTPAEPSGSPSDQEKPENGGENGKPSPEETGDKDGTLEKPPANGLPAWLPWGMAGGCASALLYLFMIHLDTRRRYRKLVADWYVDHDEPHWSFTQTDSPSEP